MLVHRYRKGRCFLTAFRTGSNKLRIETERWKKKQKEKEEERICMSCMNGKIENEKHFLIRK